MDHRNIVTQCRLSGLSDYGGGLPVSKVVIDGAACMAGLEVWDLIVLVNGEDVRLWGALDVADLLQKQHGHLHLSILRSRCVGLSSDHLSSAFDFDIVFLVSGVRSSMTSLEYCK